MNQQEIDFLDSALEKAAEMLDQNTGSGM